MYRSAFVKRVLEIFVGFYGNLRDFYGNLRDFEGNLWDFEGLQETCEKKFF